MDKKVLNNPIDSPKKEPVIKGRVVKCNSLNVRKYPKTNAGVVGIVKVGEVFKIANAKTIDGFYKVSAPGIYGYVKAEFIEII